jgi:hypothetical protein
MFLVATELVAGADSHVLAQERAQAAPTEGRPLYALHHLFSTTSAGLGGVAGEACEVERREQAESGVDDVNAVG